MTTKSQIEKISSPDQILDYLRRTGKKNRRIRNILAWVAVVYGLSVVGLLLISLLVDHHLPHAMPNTGMPLIMLCVFTALMRQAWKKAAEVGDVRCIGYLLEGMRDTDKGVVQSIRDALIKLLPQLTPENADEVLDAHQRMLLYKSITTSKSPALVKELLQAIHRVAGKEAIPFLESFREAKHPKNSEWEKASDYALQILPDIRIRAAKEIIDKKVAEAGQDWQALGNPPVEAVGHQAELSDQA